MPSLVSASPNSHLKVVFDASPRLHYNADSSEVAWLWVATSSRLEVLVEYRLRTAAPIPTTSLMSIALYPSPETELYAVALSATGTGEWRPLLDLLTELDDGRHAATLARLAELSR